VINKADRDGAERAAFAINSALELRTGAASWTPPVLLTTALEGAGVAELVERHEEHLEHLASQGTLDVRRRQRVARHLEELLRDRLWRNLRERIADHDWNRALDDLAARRLTPHQAAERLAGRGGA
jgi:LAO/AO transport system kinase